MALLSSVGDNMELKNVQGRRDSLECYHELDGVGWLAAGEVVCSR